MLATTSLFPQKVNLVTDFDFTQLLLPFVVVMSVYSVIKLFESDFRNRWSGVLFSVLSTIIVFFLYKQDIGNLFSISIGDGEALSVSNLNILTYVEAIFNKAPDTTEALLVENAVYCELAQIIVPLQIIAVSVVNLLPFAVLSLLGYLFHGVAGKAYDQFYQLHACKKAVGTILTVSLFALAAGVALMFLGQINEEIILTVTMNYTNSVLLVISLIVLLILLSVPWSIYKASYKHHYAVYEKSKGENV